MSAPIIFNGDAAKLLKNKLKFSNNVTLDASSGTLVLPTLSSEPQNQVFASPDGSAGSPTFRSLTVNDIPNLSATYVTQSEVGSANGVASLDGSGKIVVSQLPSVVMEYQGAWNPNTNTPTLSDGTGTNGYVYYVTALRAGSVSGLTDPSMVNFQIGDLIIYSSSVGKWQLVTPAAGVSSVNSSQGAVTVNAINQLTGDLTAGPASGSQSQASTLVKIQGTTVSGTTGSDNVVFSANPTLTGTLSGSAASFSSTISASNFSGSSSGTNTGDQTITLTGDVTGSGTGSFAASIAATSNSTLTTLSGLTTASSLSSVGTITSGTWSGTTIAINKGGTGQTTATTAFNALSPLTTKGDLIAYDNTNNVRLAAGTNGQVLSSDSTQTSGLKWITVSGTGTVTSVAMTVPTFLSVSGSPITTSGTLAVTLSGTALPIANGGTGQTTASAAFNGLSPITTTGDIIYSSSGTTNSRLAIGTTNQVLQVSGGIPAWTSTIRSGDGTVSAPAHSFTNQTGSGLWYNAGSAYAALSYNGTESLAWSAANVRLGSGLNLTFNGDGTGNIGGASGTQRPLDIFCTGHVRAGDGSTSTPAFNFNSNTNSGIYNNTGSGLAALVYGGVEIASWGVNLQIRGTANLTFQNDSTQSIGTTGANRPSNIFAGGNIVAEVAGKGFKVKEGSNARMGTSTLVGGTVTVSNTSVTASTRIFLTAQTTSANSGAVGISAVSAGTSFTITSTNAADTNTIAWILYEPA